MKKDRTMADTIQEEAWELEARSGGGFVYCSKPYPCGVQEALSSFKPFHAVKDGQDGNKIERKDRETVITLRPLKGSRLRKPYIIRIWV